MTDKTNPSQEEASMPHLQVLDRVKSIPVVQTALEKTGCTYSYVKDSHHLINWALNYAEAGLQYASATAAPIAAPLAKKYEDKINTIDQKLCQGLDIVEKKVPIVKQPPIEIYDAAKNVMNSSLHSTIEKLVTAKETASNQASAVKDISIKKANEILNTHYGTKFVEGIDSTSVLVNHLLDHFFPPVEGFVEEGEQGTVSAEDNKILHTVQTIGQLSSKTAHRVYHSIAAQLKTVKKEDVENYMSNVVSILHLTNFINLGQKQETSPEASSPTTENNKPKSN